MIQKKLEQTLLPVANKLIITWTFMQDRAPCHKALVVERRFQKERIFIIEWVAYYPSLRPTKTIWKMMVLKVYGRVYANSGCHNST